MPWILGGCGCLMLLLIAAALIGFGVYRTSKSVVDVASKVKAATESRAGWNTYVNVKENLPAKLQPNFVAFSFDYPDSFVVQPQGDTNFVKVEKYAAQGKGYTAENFAVGYAWFEPPSADSELLYDTLLDQLGKQFAGGFHNYKELKRIPETVAGVRGRAALFHADFNDTAKTKIYGKTILVHPPGKKNGVAIIMLATSLSPDVKSAGDLGVKGEGAEILRSFRLF